jgi:hypothetical protein
MEQLELNESVITTEKERRPKTGAGVVDSHPDRDGRRMDRQPAGNGHRSYVSHAVAAYRDHSDSVRKKLKKRLRVCTG